MRGVGEPPDALSSSAATALQTEQLTPLIRQAPPATFSHKGRRKKKAPPSKRRGLFL